MAKYFLTQKAVEDLSNIWNYTFDTWSENQADKYYQALLDSFQEIANNPTIGKMYQNIEETLLGVHMNKHIIFYRPHSGKSVEITRILHEMMDLKNHIVE